MGQRYIHSMALALIVSGGMLLSATPGWTQDGVAVDRENQGRVALAEKDYSAALELFSDGSARATDPGLKARLDFRRAVTLQQMASTPQEDNPQDKLRQAARLYHAYLKKNPHSTATANNLAKIYDLLGTESLKQSDVERATSYFGRANRYYQAAVAAGGALEGLYLKNYAEFLERTDQWDEAKKIYAQLVQEHPLSPKLQQSLAVTFKQHGLGDLAAYLWDLLDAGYVQQAADIALEAIDKSASKTDKSRVDLLTIVCASLAESTYDRASFRSSDRGEQITVAMDDDTFLGRGAGEIVRLHRGAQFSPSDYPWWAKRPIERKDPAKGLWPTDGFRALIRSLGSRSKQSGDFNLAEDYFRLAATLRKRDVDPIAVRALVQMYAETNQFQAIDGVLDEFRIRLFEGKGEAYRASDVERIFQYHQTLGELYALIEKWGSSDETASAIFQLEHARTMSIKLESTSPETLSEDYQFTPPMVDLLSRAYEKTGNPLKSVELRIDQAELYQRAGDTKATLRILAPLEASDVPSTYKSRYETLKVRPENITPVMTLERNSVSIEALQNAQPSAGEIR